MTRVRIVFPLHHREGWHNFDRHFTWSERMMGTEHPRYHEKVEAIVADRPALTPSSG